MPLPAAHRNVIQELARRLPPDRVAWALTGSGGLAVQGLEVPVGDIDIQTDAQDWRTVQEKFAGNLTRPVSYSRSERIESFFGALEMDGITIEIVGAPRQLCADGTWTPPADPRAHRRLVDVEGHKIPVLDLVWEQKSYLLLGRTAKAELIAAYLAERNTTQPLYVFEDRSGHH